MVMDMQEFRDKVLDSPEAKAAHAEIQQQFDLARMLIEIKQEKGLKSTAALAREAGISRTTLINYQSGVTSPNLAQLARMFHNLGYNIRIVLKDIE